MDKQLQRLIDLSNKTGDRLVVFDPNNASNGYVVMPIDDYEKIAVGRSEVRGLTEDELLDKINRDIAIWKSDKIDEKELPKAENDFYDDNLPNEAIGEEDDWFSVEEIANRNLERNNVDMRFGPNKSKGTWRIPSERKEKAEEIIEEDRFYLEDVED